MLYPHIPSQSRNPHPVVHAPIKTSFLLQHCAGDSAFPIAFRRSGHIGRVKSAEELTQQSSAAGPITKYDRKCGMEDADELSEKSGKKQGEGWGGGGRW
jgi:hypothetical protein